MRLEARTKEELLRELNRLHRQVEKMKLSETRLKQAEQSLRDIAEGISATVGDTFFRSLVEHLAKSLGMKYALVGELSGEAHDSIRTIALFADGKIAGTLEYRLENAPCENVIRQSLRCYPKDVQKLFPRDPLLREMNIESYVGAPLVDSEKRVIGLMVVMDDKPLNDPGSGEALLRIFAARASAELERKRIETELRESEAKFRRIIETAQEGVWVLDREAKTTYVNSRTAEMLGYDEREMLGKSPFDFLDETDRQKARESFERRRRGFKDVFDICFRKKGGAPLWCMVSASPVMDEHGRFTGSFSMIADISGRKKAEEALKLNESRLKALLELSQMSEASLQEVSKFVLEQAVKLTSSRFGLVGFLSEGGKDFTAYALSKSVMKKCMTVDQPLHFTIAEAGVWAEAVRQKKPFVMNDYQAPHAAKKGLPPGHVPMTRLLSIPVSDGDRVVGVAAVGNKEASYDDADVQQLTLLMNGMWRHIRRKQTEEELLRAQKLESLGILAGGLAHDFNNLLTGILGNIEMAKLYADPGDKVYERLTEAGKAFSRAKDLTRQLLTFSRGGEPARKTVAIAPLVREAGSFALRGTNVRCEFLIPEDVPPVEADEGQISQVVNNLVINACQAMTNGGTITFRVEAVSVQSGDALPLPPGGYVKIAVQDRGTGIPREHLSKIFDPYFTTKHEGSGLGLATSYSIVKRHDGHMTVESEPGKGATFTIYLPASPGKAAEKRTAEELPAKGTGKILLMDDEEVVRNTAAEMLRYLGYEVELAEDGAQAIERYCEARDSARPFDAVIMDLTVPGGMGGREAIQKLHETAPGARVIVSSGYSSDPVLSNYAAYGFCGIVTKPYKVSELSEAVHKALLPQK